MSPSGSHPVSQPLVSACAGQTQLKPVGTGDGDRPVVADRRVRKGEDGTEDDQDRKSCSSQQQGLVLLSSQ